MARMKSSHGYLIALTPYQGALKIPILLVFAHPDDVDEVMDRVFFTNLLRYASDVYEKKVSLNPFQIMLTQSVLSSPKCRIRA